MTECFCHSHYRKKKVERELNQVISACHILKLVRKLVVFSEQKLDQISSSYVFLKKKRLATKLGTAKYKIFLLPVKQIFK